MYAIFITSTFCYSLVAWTNQYLPSSIMTAFWPVQVRIKTQDLWTAWANRPLGPGIMWSLGSALLTWHQDLGYIMWPPLGPHTWPGNDLWGGCGLCFMESCPQKCPCIEGRLIRTWGLIVVGGTSDGWLDSVQISGNSCPSVDRQWQQSSLHIWSLGWSWHSGYVQNPWEAQYHFFALSLSSNA